MKNFPKNEKLNSKILNGGYDSFSTVRLLGTFFLVVFFQVVVLIVIRIILVFEGIIHCFSGCKWDYLRNFYEKTKKELFWNGIIRLILESYLEVCMMVLIV